MSNAVSPTRRALTLLLAAAVAFLGCAMLLAAGGTFPDLVGGARGSRQPDLLLLAVVILLGAAGGLLVALAAKDLWDVRRRSRAR